MRKTEVYSALSICRHIVRVALTRKLIYFFGFIFVVSFLAFYAFLWKLNASFRDSATRLPAVLSEYGLTVSGIKFEDLSLNGPKALTLRNLRLTFADAKQAKGREPFIFRTDNITLVSKDFSYDDLQLTTHKFAISNPNRGSRRIIDKNALKPQLFGGRIDGNYLLTHFPSDFSNPGESVQKHLKDLASFLTDGAFKTDVALNAAAIFKIGESVYRVPLQASVSVDAENKTETRLSLSVSELTPIKKHFGDAISNEELDFIVAHPLDGALLVSIKDVAERTAEKIHLNDKSIPKRELIHVIYGYLIEPKFTPEVKKTLISAYRASTTGKNELTLLDKYVELGSTLSKNGLDDSAFVQRISTKGVVTTALEKLKWSVK